MAAKHILGAAFNQGAFPTIGVVNLATVDLVLGQLGCGNYRPVFEPVVEITSLDWRSKWISLEPVVEGPFTEADPVRLIYLDESGLGEERFLVVAGVIVEADSQYMAVARHLRALIAEVVPPEKRHGFAFEAKK